MKIQRAYNLRFSFILAAVLLSLTHFYGIAMAQETDAIPLVAQDKTIILAAEDSWLLLLISLAKVFPIA